ncbi:hypothetical protein [Marinomonas epiphytica]
MPFHRLGLLLFTLFLSGCSLITSEPHTAHKPNQEDAQPIVATEISKNTNHNDAVTEDTPKQQTSIQDPVFTESSLTSSQSEQLQELREKAQESHFILTQILGSDYAQAPPSASIFINQDNFQTQLEALQNYQDNVEGDLKALELRTELRKNKPILGDKIQLFIENAEVEHPDNLFQAQSIIGQWIRGASREIRLTNNFLIEDPKSEIIHISFNEAYQIVLNGQAVSVVDPNKEEGQGLFRINTIDNIGHISGQFTYRLINK